MPATDGTLRILLLRATPGGARLTSLLVTSILFALAIGAFLAIRRLAGSLTAPLPAPQLVATAAGLCVWAILVREFSAKRQAVVWSLLGVLTLFAVGCSYPANRLVDWLVWLPVIGLFVWWSAATFLKRRQPARRSSLASEVAAISEKVLQQLSRVRTVDGKDAVRGTLVAEFECGERQTTLYVGFCPPFELLPEIDINVIDDLEADVKLTQVLHNGAQIDVRLSEPAVEAASVTLEFFAIEPGMLSDAL